MTSILVVDDSKIDLKRASLLLQKHLDSVSIETATNGRDALETIQQHQPNLVVTDLQMPHMNGLELLIEVRKQFPLIPVVLMTGAGSEEIASEALAKGAASYVPKSQLAADLPSIVKQLLGLVSEKRQILKLQNRLIDIKFQLETDQSLLASFVQVLRDHLRVTHFFSDNESYRVMSAVDEALANAYYHGNLEVCSTLREEDATAFHALAQERLQLLPYRDRHIFVRVQFAGKFSITIQDEGPGFDPSKLPDPLAPGFVERPCGRGLLLMRTFMDHVHFNGQGNEVTMVKEFPTAKKS